ncbi:phage tail protein [Streptomyces afghaniensis]|uniref:phage tail protein n=1 Tax=Streptomyces TaxID=1883 RepID=UPI001FAF5C90|nr:phage tail protein [Streptomyces sp. HP-A2021]UOB15372.1 phage tail protein [Streptomyces sp. HP-A2021]
MPHSRYLRHLPPELWEDSPEEPELSLNSMLLVFEEILTGVADPVPVVHENHTRAGDESHPHRPIAEQIARLDQLYDPWAAPPEFLPWLASWVSLRFPELQGRQLWDEYQRRKAIAVISRIHRARGLRAGLNGILDLHSVGKVRPRAAVDDGSSLFTTRLTEGAPAPVHALPTFRPLLEGLTEDTPAAVTREGLLRPWCVAHGSDGSLFVGDRGLPEEVSLPHRRRVWRLDTTGQPDLAGSPPVPRPLIPDQTLGPVVAVAVRPALTGMPETLFVLDRGGTVLSVPDLDAASATEVARLSSSGPVFPLAMAVDHAGDLLVLDRRLMPGEEPTPRVFIVRPQSAQVTVKELDATAVREPLSLFVDHDDTLVVGDGGDQQAEARGAGGGNLVRIVRGAPDWTHTPLLPPDNGLVAPTATVRTRPDGLYVLDAGLRPFWPESTGDPFILFDAVPACVHRVTGAPGPTAAVVRVTEPGQFVSPTGMTAAGRHVVVCDPGQNSRNDTLDDYRARLAPYEINVAVHFCAEDLSQDPEQRRREVTGALGDIRSIVARYKPGHCRFSAVTTF